MYIWLSNIFILSLKEVKSLLSDLILVALMVYFFTVAVVVAAKGASQEVRNAPVAVADHDVSALSLRLRDAVRPPHFKIPESVSDEDVQRHMDLGDYYFVLDIPPNYEKDYLDGIIRSNAEKAGYYANKTLRKVQKKVGFPEKPR